VAAVQAGAWIVMWVALRRDPALFEPGYDAEFVRSESRQAWVGFVAFDLIALIGLVSPVAALVLYLLAILGYGHQQWSELPASTPNRPDRRVGRICPAAEAK
jgi:hypothetical protein